MPAHIAGVEHVRNTYEWALPLLSTRKRAFVDQLIPRIHSNGTLDRGTSPLLTNEKTCEMSWFNIPVLFV